MQNKNSQEQFSQIVPLATIDGAEWFLHRDIDVSVLLYTTLRVDEKIENPLQTQGKIF